MFLDIYYLNFLFSFSSLQLSLTPFIPLFFFIFIFYYLRSMESTIIAIHDMTFVLFIVEIQSIFEIFSLFANSVKLIHFCTNSSQNPFTLCVNAFPLNKYIFFHHCFTFSLSIWFLLNPMAKTQLNYLFDLMRSITYISTLELYEFLCTFPQEKNQAKNNKMLLSRIGLNFF